MKPFEKNILSWVKFILQFLSFSIFCYIFVAHLLRLIRPAEAYIDLRLFDITYLRFILFIGFLTGLTGLSVSLLLGQISLVPLSGQKRDEKVIYAITALFMAIFYNGAFGFLKIFQYPLFILLVVFFYFSVPALIQFYLSFNYKEVKSLLDQIYSVLKNKSFKPLYDKTFDFDKELTAAKKKIKTNVIPYIGFVTFILFTLLISVFSFLFVSQIIKDYIQGNIYKENQLRKRLYIKKILPQKTMHAQKVIIEGYNFGWNPTGDSGYRIMTSEGPIRLIETWTNEQLLFIVSLDIPIGKKEIWVEKPADNPNNKKVLKSNTVSLDVISRFIIYPDVGDSLLTKISKRIKRVFFTDIKIFNPYIF